MFPTATRVNIASLVTGANSGTHGIVNNSIFEPGVSPTEPADLGKYDVVEAADAYYQGTLLHSPSLGEILATHGESMVASAGTTGSNRLMHHKVKSVGGIGFSVHGAAASYPSSETATIVARFGAPPAAGTPDAARLAYITDVFLQYLFPVHHPRVAVLWFSDPDKTYHYCGIGSAESRQAIRAADAQLGRIMDGCNTRRNGTSSISSSCQTMGTSLSVSRYRCNRPSPQSAYRPGMAVLALEMWR